MNHCFKPRNRTRSQRSHGIPRDLIGSLRRTTNEPRNARSLRFEVRKQRIPDWPRNSTNQNTFQDVSNAYSSRLKGGEGLPRPPRRSRHYEAFKKGYVPSPAPPFNLCHPALSWLMLAPKGGDTANPQQAVPGWVKILHGDVASADRDQRAHGDP